MNHKQFTINRRAFTLIEILISTAIFATVALIANVVVAQSMGYLTKLKVVRSTTQDAAKVAEAISVDFRGANAPIKLGGRTFKNGFVPLQCTQDVNHISIRGVANGYFKYVPTDYTDSTNTIFLLSKTEDNKYKMIIYKIYSTGYAAANTVKRGEFILSSISSYDESDGPDQAGEVNNVCGIDTSLFFSKNSDGDTFTPDYDNAITIPNWSGYVRDASSLSDRQSYLDFTIDVKSPNYSTAREQERSWTSIKSSITARSLSL